MSAEAERRELLKEPVPRWCDAFLCPLWLFLTLLLFPCAPVPPLPSLTLKMQVCFWASFKCICSLALTSSAFLCALAADSSLEPPSSMGGGGLPPLPKMLPYYYRGKTVSFALVVAILLQKIWNADKILQYFRQKFNFAFCPLARHTKVINVHFVRSLHVACLFSLVFSPLSEVIFAAWSAKCTQPRVSHSVFPCNQLKIWIAQSTLNLSSAFLIPCLHCRSSLSEQIQRQT